jgi:hypothetical protein
MGIKDELSSFVLSNASKNRLNTILLCLFSTSCAFISWTLYSPSPPLNAQEILSRCAQLHAKAGPPSNFHERDVSDRFEAGTPATLIRNATIWTGAHDGTEVIYGDILLDKGIIKAVGYIPNPLIQEAVDFSGSIKTIDANGAWITPGIFDLHSHVGVLSAPTLAGEPFLIAFECLS